MQPKQYDAPGYERDTSYDAFERRPEPNDRQQKKVIAVLSRKDPSIISVREVELRRGEAEQFHRNWEAGAIKPSDVKSFLVNVMAPCDTIPPAELYGRFRNFPRAHQIRGIISVAISSGDLDQTRIVDAFERRNEVGVEEYEQFMGMYEEPATLERRMQILLETIERINGPRKREEYERSLRVLMGVTWGKRSDYWEQFKLLVENDNSPNWNSSEKAASQEKAPTEAALKDEGIIRKAVTSISADSTSGERRSAYASNNERLAPALEMLQSAHKVPFVLENDRESHLYSIPEQPDITDEQASRVIEDLGRRMLEVDPSASAPGEFRRRMLFSCIPRSGIDTRAAFATKNTLHRLLVERVHDDSYFQELMENAKVYA
ncbi:MAG: hypothetical protein WC243_04515 [Patescibacteria group bacterium]|jgi:hypothetical protein